MDADCQCCGSQFDFNPIWCHRRITPTMECGCMAQPINDQLCGECVDGACEGLHIWQEDDGEWCKWGALNGARAIVAPSADEIEAFQRLHSEAQSK